MNVFDYLATKVPATTLDLLYESPWTCQAVFRSLPHLGKQYVMRLLCINEPVAKQLIDQWIRGDSAAQGRHKASLTRLEALRVFLNIPKEKNTGSAAFRIYLE
mmetsp:Transcript_20044/g.32891  ORF Transcript_20044/g.32891 Transcript_20044/m.32891 type:complete len:103 (+) Transcript_20044:81-389(+)